LFNAYRKNHPIIFWLIIALAILMLSFSIGSVFFVKDEYSQTVVSDLSAPFYNLIATIALIFAAKQSSRISKRLAWGWSMLVIAQFSFTLGDILWAILELYLKSTPYPSIADVFYLLFYPLFFAGILLLSLNRLSRTEWLKNAMDLSIVMIAAVLGFWIFLIGPIIGAEPIASLMEKILSLAYPAGDLVLLFTLLIIMYYRSEKFILGSMLLLALYALAMIVTDSLFSYQSLMGTYTSGGILDLSYLLSYMLIAFAGIYQAAASQTYKESDTSPDKNFIFSARIAQILEYMPYIWVLIAFFLLINYHHSETLISSDILIISVGCIIGLVIIRQIITLGENKYFLSNLGKALEKEDRQTFHLNKINRNLKQEIKRRKSAEELLSYDVLHDRLTGLANRVLLIDRLEHALEITKREQEFHYSILFLDIDNFKPINDALGHSSGDQALIEIVKIFKNCTRSIDTVARLAGDEFVILLDHSLERNTAISVADRILTELKDPLIIKGNEVLISCSIGIVQGISEYTHSEDILKDADIALYRAKEEGKARYEVFTIDMRMSNTHRLETEGDLRKAITNNELFLVYQPIYSLEQNHIEGVEALVRWRHPLRGLIMPYEFIKIAEESEIIIQIGDWVLHAACTQMRKWHIEYPDFDFLSVNVNISGKQIKQRDFVDKVKETLQASGLNPNRLALEITETAFINNQLIIDKLLSSLRKIGVTFAIDDFGTGYSSLGYLQNFTVDTIKIDKSFVDEMVASKKGYEIIKTIILMADGMGMNTVAEGIENNEQLQKLRSLMCKYGQGYFLSKPAEVKQIETLFKKQAVLEVS